TTSFSAVEIAGATGTETFKLGTFSYGENSPAEPINLNYNIRGVDGDGDGVNSTLNTSLYPTSQSIVGTSNNETLSADSNHHYVFGNGGNDTLNGSSGIDLLSGGDGNDKLQGNAGYDILNGGAGSDLFIFSAAASNGVDTVQDFTVTAKASGGDVLDITDLLSGASVSTASFNADEGAFLQFVSDGSGNTKVMFDADGSGVGNPATQVAVLNGVNPTDLLNTLLANDQIQTNH
ncbi:MAG: calcium-binding protein, partial [Deefgea sp.]